MNESKISRREALGRTGCLLGAALASPIVVEAEAALSVPASLSGGPFRFCLNTATIRGQKVGIVKEVEIAAKAGYGSLEPWIDTIRDYVRGGGELKELRQRISDAGLVIESAIGFPEWVVEDDARRAKGLTQAKQDLELVAQIGGKRLAAPPAGATDLPKLDPAKVVERYRALLEAGDQIGVVPQLELWGGSRNLNHLGECVGIAMETGHPKACVLADVFHLYKGGSDFHGMRLLGSQTIQVLHMNDYPAEPPREKIDDSYRIFPGEGVAPLPELLRTLHHTGGQKVLSLELFNRKYWAEDPLEVAKTGLAKMHAVVEAAKV
jgi:sugar phosphate isomerase/epimerase